MGSETYADIDPASWPETLALAEVFLACEELRSKGMLDGGPKVNVEKMKKLVAAGKAMGHSYTPEQFKAATRYVASGEYLADMEDGEHPDV